MGHFTTKNKLKPHRHAKIPVSMRMECLLFGLFYIGEKRRTLDKGYGIE
jgi:hypothetical protein